MSVHHRAFKAIATLALCAASIDASNAAPLAYPIQVSHSANLDPSFSPDGRRYVYLSIISGREQLFLANADGTASEQLTFDAVDHEDPAWSPDGKSIAYVRMLDGQQRIHILNLDTRKDEALTPASIHVIHPNWHPDGSRIYYCTTDDLRPPEKNESEIQYIDLATRTITTVIRGGVNTYPKVSPDGQHIAYRRILGEMNSEVYVASIDGSKPRNLTEHWSFDGWPNWSPDGQHLVFASNRQNSYKIYRMNRDGANVELLANTEGRATAPVYHPNGNQVYFPLCRGVDNGVDCQILSASLPTAQP